MKPAKRLGLVLDALDLEPDPRQRLDDLVERCPGVEVVLQPGEGEFHGVTCCKGLGSGASNQSRSEELTFVGIETIDQADRLTDTLDQSQGLVSADPIPGVIIRRMPQLLKLAKNLARNDGVVAELAASTQVAENFSRACVIERAIDMPKRLPRPPRPHELSGAELSQGMKQRVVGRRYGSAPGDVSRASGLAVSEFEGDLQEFGVHSVHLQWRGALGLFIVGMTHAEIGEAIFSGFQQLPAQCMMHAGGDLAGDRR